MHIAIVAPEQSRIPAVSGSVGICISALAKQLAARHRVTIISPSYPGAPKRTALGRGLTIRRVAAGSIDAYLRGVLHVLQQTAPDVVQIDNRPVWVRPVKNQLPHTPVSLFLHSLSFVSPDKISRNEAAACLSCADLVIANSSSLKEELIGRFPGAAGRIHRVWLGVDTSRFRPAPREKDPAGRAYRQNRDYTVLYSGRLVRGKGVPVLIRAVRLAAERTGRRIRLLLAGGAARPAYATQLRRMAAREGVRAHFLGTIPHSRMPKIYRRADCLVCPSQKHEAFGLVNVEAMASGLPVIAANNGGIREVIRHGASGLLVKDYSRPEAYAAYIAKLMHAPDLNRKLIISGRLEVLRRFSWKAAADRLERLYSRAAVARKRRGGTF